MSKPIEEIEGIGPVFGKKLRKAGISTTGALLKAGTTRKGRNELAKTTGVSHSIILRSVNMADLFRVKGVARQYSELLEASGVDSVKELRNRRADNLTVKMREVNAKKRVCKVCPGEKTVSGWISQAKKLKPVIQY